MMIFVKLGTLDLGLRRPHFFGWGAFLGLSEHVAMDQYLYIPFLGG